MRRTAVSELGGAPDAGLTARLLQGRCRRRVGCRGRRRVDGELPGGPLRGVDRRCRFYARLAARPCSAAQGGLGTTLGRTQKPLLKPSSAPGHPAVNPVPGYSSPPATSAKLAIRPAWPPDGRPACSTGVLRPPGPTEHARLAHRVDRPRAWTALATSLERRGSRAA